MMEHKSWLWKKKSTEKTMITPDKINKGNEDEANLADKVELEKNLKISDEKLSAALAEINTKEEIAQKQTNIAREAIQGWEKAETEVLALKQELEKLIHQRVADEERTNGADAALNECMLQLRFVREEQEKRIHDVVTKTANECEKRIMGLEEKLNESNKKVSKLGLENTQLVTTLSSKEKMINELHSNRAQLEYDLSNIEENIILDKMNRQKVSEVEKLTQTVRELEEAVLAGGAAANVVRDFQRKLQETNEEKRILDRELARAKISANRVAVVVANDWKDADNKVMPGEMQQLKEKLTVAESTAKAESQLKEKYLLRFKVLEERFKSCSRNGISSAAPNRPMSNGRAPRQSLGGVENLSRSASSRFSSRTLLKSGSISSKVYDCSKLINSGKLFPNGSDNTNEKDASKPEDFVSGMLYDMLQKEVLILQKAGQQKDQKLEEKDNMIEILARNIDTLNKRGKTSS